MAKQSLFDRLLARGIRDGRVPAKTQAARDWYRKVAAKERSNKRNSILSEKARMTSSIEIGKMYFFQYDAKYKNTLPYWDAFPLIFPFKESGPHFYGINLHYLPPALRARLMDELYGLATDDKFNSKTRLALSYSILTKLSKSKLAEVCVKKYLKSNVRSRFIEVNSSEWDIALFLPVASWRNSSAKSVYADSRRKIK